ncbi:hypothetical protein HanHA300_Chr06g0222751 [Helianthus annuus]|nr:hypothetical protein HanHA300_Chr06g0222751 [Helianthus annuus]KAJ0568066.1 hypothetical protein HanIR_Chr06g0291901 [Helianthus annuus]KAJ0916506.1 hypothetical protein HanPSC8_Chr06g0262441 [Helianthus annuus]
MMLGRMSRKARPVMREKSGEVAPLCRMFDPGFKGKFEVLACADGEEGFNLTIRDNFRLPEQEAMEAELPQGKGDLGALGDPDATGVPKKHVEKHGGVRFRKPKKTHEPAVVPPLVPQVAGISRTRLRRYNDYVVVSDTLEGLGVPGGGEAAVGSSAGSEPADDKKRKGDSPAAGGPKGRKLRRTRGVTIPERTPAVTTKPREETFSFFDLPSSPPRDATVDAGVRKEGRRSPSIEVVTPPSTHVEDTGKKAAGQSIADTLDSSNNLIDPQDSEVQGSEKLKSSKTVGCGAWVGGKTPKPPPLGAWVRAWPLGLRFEAGCGAGLGLMWRPPIRLGF